MKNGGKLNGKAGPGKDKRQRNVVADSTCHNKWLVFQNRLTKLLAILRTQGHFVEVMTQQKRERTASQDNEVSEVTRCLHKIGAAKCSIIALFQEISSQNKDHKMFPQLEADADESGLIDVDEVMRCDVWCLNIHFRQHLLRPHLLLTIVRCRCYYVLFFDIAAKITGCVFTLWC